MSGISVANVHVHIGDQFVESVQNSILQSIRAYMKNKAFIEIVDPDPEHDLVDADRIFVVSAAATPWITVYDNAFEENILDTHALIEISKMLSTETFSTVLGIMLYHSRVLDMHLYHQGETVDMFSNDVDYLRTLPDEQREQYGGCPERWQMLLADTATVADLRRMWEMDAAEQMLADILPLLQLSELHCFMSLDDTDELGDENCTILAFRTTQTPTYTIKAQGLPRFEWYAVSGLLQTIGEDTSAKDCGMVSVRNIGGASHGLQIIVTGDALERNLFQPQIVYVVDTDHMLEHTTIDHKDAYILTLPALTIPAGLADPFSSWQAEPGQLDKAMNADSATRITVLIGGQGKAIGSGTLSITLIPLANPEQGQYTCTFPVVIKEPGDNGSSTVLMIPGPQ